MAQAITPELEELLVEKLQTGDRKFKGEIEVDYVVGSTTEIGDPTNLSIGASIIQDPANTIDWSGDVNLIIDGSTVTACGIDFTSGFYHHGVIVDLGAPGVVSSVRVNATDSGLDHPHYIESSDDGVTWTPLVSPLDTWTIGTGIDNGWRIWTFSSPVTAQYWRAYWEATGTHVGYGFREWEIIGEAITVVEPIVSTVRLQVASLSIDRSRKMAAAQLDVTVANEDGTRGWYTGDGTVFVPNNPVRAYAWYGDRANRVCIYTGLLDRVHEHRNPRTLELKARSRMKWLIEQGFTASAPQGEDEDGAVRTEANGVYLDKTIEYIVGDILDRGGWPSADRAITSTGITLDEYVLADGSWLDQIVGSDRLAAAAGFDCGEDELGIFRFEPSPLLAATEPDPDWAFAAGVNVLELDHEVDDEDRATRVMVTGPMTSTVPKWKEVWHSSVLRYPAGIWYDPTDDDYIRAIDRVTKYLYRIKQSNRSIASKKYLGGHPLGLSGIPGDNDHYLVQHSPWRNTGNDTNNRIQKRAKVGHAVVATYPLPDGRWTAMKCDGSNIFLTNYDDNKLYKRSMTGTAVSSGTITVDGEVQEKPTGLWINGTTIGVFFAGHKRFILTDTSAPYTPTGRQSTKGTRLAGGEADTDTGVDLYGDADAGSFGLTSGYLAKFTLAELITKDVSALAIDYDLEDELGLQSGIAARDHDGCPNSDDPHPFEARLSTYAMKVVQSLDQAGDMAAARLALLKRLRRVMDLAAIGNPGVQLNDVASYTDAIAGIPTPPWIVDSYRIRLAKTYIQTMSVLPWEAA